MCSIVIQIYHDSADVYCTVGEKRLVTNEFNALVGNKVIGFFYGKEYTVLLCGVPQCNIFVQAPFSLPAIGRRRRRRRRVDEKGHFDEAEKGRRGKQERI